MQRNYEVTIVLEQKYYEYVFLTQDRYVIVNIISVWLIKKKKGTELAEDWLLIVLVEGWLLKVLVEDWLGRVLLEA